ncbi:antigen, partial [Aphelenchoides avenae]
MGYIFGNVTDAEEAAGGAGGGHKIKAAERVALFIVPETQYLQLLANGPFDGRRSDMCSTILRNISAIAFEPKCFPKGRSDILRWAPCEKGNLCADEDDPKKVISGYQFTFRVKEPITPQFWYVVLMACTLNDNCTWVRSTSVSTVRYDLWLVNGNPLVNAGDPLSKQFSFDEQTMPEMYFCALAAYIILASIQAKGISVSKHRRMPPRQRTLTWIIGLELTGLFFESVNALIFAAAGRGVGLFSFTGELCIVLATCLLCLLLILLSRGWSLNTSASDAYNSITHYVWLLVSGVHVGFFVHNYFFTEGVPKRVDFYKSWAGYGIVGIRLLQALWFLFEVKRTIRRELNESRAIFLANFGAAYMVWFVYLVGLGAIAGFISDLWRLKVIL